MLERALLIVPLLAGCQNGPPPLVVKERKASQPLHLASEPYQQMLAELDRSPEGDECVAVRLEGDDAPVLDEVLVEVAQVL